MLYSVFIISIRPAIIGTFLLKCHRCAIPFNSPEIWEVMIEKGGCCSKYAIWFLGTLFKKTNFHISTLLSEFHETF